MLPRLKKGARATLCERAAELLALWVKGKSPATCRAYAADLAAFAAWGGASSSDEATAALLTLGPTKANAAVEEWRNEMVGRVAPRTIARRLSTLRSFVRHAQMKRACNWTISVKAKGARGFTKDTRGPRPREVGRVIARCERATTEPSWARRSNGAQAVRDLAVLLLLCDSGLRRAEVCTLHVRHVDLAVGMVQIAAKGGGDDDREWWPVSYRAQRALRHWLGYRGARPGPVFTRNCYGFYGDDAIDGSTVYRIVRRRAAACGFAGWRPHALRHTGVTVIKRKTGDLELAQRFGRHASPATTSRHYVDAEPDELRQLVEAVAAACSVDRRHASARRLPRGVRPRSPVPSHAQHG